MPPRFYSIFTPVLRYLSVLHTPPPVHCVPRRFITRRDILPQTGFGQLRNMATAERNINLTYEDIIALKAKNEIILVDVRDHNEIQETGKLPDSIHIPLGELSDALKSPAEEFQKKYGALQFSKDAPLVFSCRSGKRSIRAMTAATEAGFNKWHKTLRRWLPGLGGKVEEVEMPRMKTKNVVMILDQAYNFTPPVRYSAWWEVLSRVKTLESGGSKLHHYTDRGLKMASERNVNLSYEEVLELKAKNEIILVDVREPSEIQETGKLPDSIHIPLGDLAGALQGPAEEFKAKYGVDQFAKDAELVFSCKGGTRSNKAMIAAKELGFTNARHYKGGFMDWEKNTKK
ncbi:hypothetical protein B566_EDAN016369 [Ephemera danica]|nr:hypothetical protein B566_EDAN016369 [Ephemera danica]